MAACSHFHQSPGTLTIPGTTNTAQDNLVGPSTQGNHRHYLIERLVGVGKKRNLLSGYQRIVQVDTGNTRSDQLGRLLTTNRVHRRTTDFDIFTFGNGTAIDRITIRIEETAGQLVAHFQSGASITKDGKKQTFACPAPQAVVADVDIIAGAPEATIVNYQLYQLNNAMAKTKEQ